MVQYRYQPKYGGLLRCYKNYSIIVTTLEVTFQLHDIYRKYCYFNLLIDWSQSHFRYWCLFCQCQFLIEKEAGMPRLYHRPPEGKLTILVNNDCNVRDSNLRINRLVIQQLNYLYHFATYIRMRLHIKGLPVTLENKKKFRQLKNKYDHIVVLYDTRCTDIVYK